MKNLTLLLLAAFTFSGCQTPSTSPTPTAPITANPETPDSQTPPSFRQCGKKPAGTIMCTMQYDPVCAKVNNNGVISYKTFGNACSACNGEDNVISTTKGACGSEK